jgi:hypothetical protein
LGALEDSADKSALSVFSNRRIRLVLLIRGSFYRLIERFSSSLSVAVDPHFDLFDEALILVEPKLLIQDNLPY